MHSYAASAERGARWLIGLLQPDGSLRGAGTLEGYYKAPFALLVTGHVAEAERVLDHVARAFLLEGGDLDGTGVSWFEEFRTYPHAWLAVAALMRGRFEMAHGLLRVLVDFHDPATGGFFATGEGRRQRRGRQEVMTTSMAALACLWAGRLDIARATGQWLEWLYQAQPDLARGLYCVWDSAAGLVTEFPPAEAKAFLVDARQTMQWYFQYGIAAAFLSSLSAATGERKWLDLAQKFLRASRHCREDVYCQPQSGKIGWGAAWTYRLSRDPEDRKVAEAVAEGLEALQSPEGWWSALSAYDFQSAAKVEPNIDVTSEFVGQMGCISLVLASGEA